MQISQVLGENIFLLWYLKLKNYMAEISLRIHLFYKISNEMILSFSK